MKLLLVLILLSMFASFTLSEPVLAKADFYTYDEQNRTATLWKNQVKWIMVENRGMEKDIDEVREYLRVSSNYRYNFSVLDDFREDYEVHKGKSKVSDLSTEYHSLIAENYTVIVNDTQLQWENTSREVLNNQTGLNETVWDNRTVQVVVGNHTEERTRMNESLFVPTNRKIDAGQSLDFVKITKKRAELGEFYILLKPMFMGVPIKALTWWNDSWSEKKPILLNNTGNATTLTYFQVPVNVTWNSNMNGNGTDFRVVNDTNGTTQPFWIDYNSSVNGSYINLWTNLSSIPASVWTNSTYYLYYGNPSAASASNGTNAFDFFGDNINKFSFTDPSKWSMNGTKLSSNNTVGNTGGLLVGVSKTDFIYEAIMETSSQPSGNYGLDVRYTNYDSNVVGLYFGRTSNVMSIWQGSVLSTWATDSASFISNATPYAVKFIATGTNEYGYADANQTTATTLRISGINSEVGTSIGFRAGSISGQYFDKLRVRKYASPEPSASLGAEESTPPFNQSVYNTGWQAVFINSTQNMTSIKSMMNSSNVNWIIKWNATSQKWETYKAGWSIGATRTISGGDAAYIKFQSNDTIVSRQPGAGNYNWTLLAGWNLVGLDRNGSRTLAQVNTSINSLGTCDANLISYKNLSTQAESLFTCGQAGNASVSVNQGEGMFVNSTITINRSRAW